MIVVVDTSILLPLLQPGTSVPKPPAGIDPGSATRRIEHLIDELDAQRAVALVPTPVLSELLIRADASAADLLSRLAALRVFRISPFDERAAIECAMLLAARLRSTRKSMPATRATVKFDHQIVAIAKIHGAIRIYSDNRDDFEPICKPAGIEVVGLWELPEPPVDPQPSLPLDAPDPAGKGGLSPLPRRRPVPG